MRGGGNWLPILALLIALYLIAAGLAGLVHLVRARITRHRQLADHPDAGIDASEDL